MTFAHDVYEHAGRVFTIRRDAHGKAVAMVPRDGLLYTRELCDAALDAYLNDAGDFASVRAAIRDGARREPAPPPAPETVPTPTRWRSPHTMKPSVGDPSPVPCPSCDGPLTVGAKACPTCHATL